MSRRLPRPLRRLIALFTWNARDDEMDREMAFHLESMTTEYMGGGMSRADAERAARRRFGNVLRHKEEGHAVRSSPFIEDIMRDVRQMGRGLLRNYGFAIAVVLTLAVGIGGNTAIFSVVDQLLLRPLPYPDGERLLTVYEAFQSGFGRIGGRRNVVSPANWLDWQRDSKTIESFAAWQSVPGAITMTGVGEPTRLNVQIVSSEFFPLLGVEPLLGRTVSADDDRPNAPGVAVLSYQLWQRRFGGDAGAIGRVVQLNEQPVEIIGVMPAGFRVIYPDNDMWGAFRLDRSRPWRENSGRFMNVAAKLRAGSTIDDARAEMDAIARRLEAMHPFNKGSGVTLVSMREELTGQVQGSLLILYAAVGVLLAIACFNVANLLLARSAARRREIAIRTSLGAGRLAIVRQLLVESLLLAIVGGALGIALARWSLAALMAFAPADLLRVPELLVDRRVLLYAVGVSLLTGVVVGLVPAVLASRQSIVETIRSGGSR